MKEDIAQLVRSKLHATLKPLGFTRKRSASFLQDGEVVKLIFGDNMTRSWDEGKFLRMGYCISSDRLEQQLFSQPMASPGTGIITSMYSPTAPGLRLTEVKNIEEANQLAEVYCRTAREYLLPIFDQIHDERSMFEFGLNNPEHIVVFEKPFKEWIVKAGYEDLLIGRTGTVNPR